MDIRYELSREKRMDGALKRLESDLRKIEQEWRRARIDAGEKDLRISRAWDAYRAAAEPAYLRVR